MPVESITIRPKSVDEIRQTFTDWWKQSHRSLAPDIRFSQPTHARNLLHMWSRLKPNARLQLDKNQLSCELAGRRFHLLLYDFDVKTEVRDRMLYFEFKLSESPAGFLNEKLAAIRKTKHPIFFSRALEALKEFELVLPKERIDEASAAPTDYMVLLEALATPSLATELATKDPLAAARLRGVERQRSLLEKSGGVLTAEQAAELLGISRQAVDKRRRQGQLIGLTQGRRGYAYPAWQFEDRKTLPNLESVLDQLREHDSWMQLAFFVNSNDRLNGRTPLEELRSTRNLEPVLAAAANYGEHGAA